MAGLLLAVALAALAAGGGRAAQPAAEKPAAEAAAPVKPKKVCVDEAPTGSLMRKRICATPEEWERRRREDAEAMSYSGGTNTCRGDGC